MNIDQHATALGRRPTAKRRTGPPPAYQIKGFANREVIKHGMTILINVGQNAKTFGNAVESPAKY